MKGKAVGFTIPGAPRGKGRPQWNPRSKCGRFAYTPKTTKDYEALVRRRYFEAHGDFKFPDNVPLEIEVCAYFKIPKSTSKAMKAKMLEGKIRPLIKPDFDNIAKIVADALNGIAYKDDKQITDSHVRKRYAENPEVLAEIWEVEVEE